MGNLFDRIRTEFSSVSGWAANIADILLVGALLFLLFVFLKKHSSQRLIKFVIGGVLLIAVFSTSLFDGRVIRTLASAGLLLALLAVVLLFNQELRRSIFKLSSGRGQAQAFSTQYDVSDEQLKVSIDEIVRAAQNMSKKDVGALMIIAPHEIPANILDSGTKLDAVLSAALLESIFNNKAPLHDGAVFIRGNRIIASGCFLPLTQNVEIDRELGTRHRAAIGVTETNNMLAIIVSEETGVISVAIGGEITRFYDSAMLADKLEQVYGLKALKSAGGRKMRKRK